jgi:hypothetical protein
MISCYSAVVTALCNFLAVVLDPSAPKKKIRRFGGIFQRSFTSDLFFFISHC